VALRIERFDGAHGFDDPAVPASLTVEQLTARAVPKLRYPLTDVSSGKPLRYSMLHEGTELARDQTVGTAIQKPRSVVHVVHEYTNAGLRPGLRPAAVRRGRSPRAR
jgi:hypothetical protein